MVQAIKGAGERAASLTRQLLAFSRKQIVAPRVLDLNQLVREADKLLRRLIGEDVELACRLAPSLWPVTADPGQVEQVLMNLAVNSRDAMPRGGKLTLETSNVQLDQTYTRTNPRAHPGPHVLLAVSDTGVGMDEATRARAFEPFFTTKGEKGTGLGLATVYAIVEQSGGHVQIYSEPGHGTTFKVYLPRTEQTASPRSRAESVPMPRGTETVLLVEDEPSVRTLAARVLAQCGYTVLQASEGAEALEVARRHPGLIHLAVVDVVLPRLGGRDTVEQVRAWQPDAKVLFISGYTDDAIVRHGILEAQVPFLHKPFTPSALAHKVREVLGPG
jgi:CheY-like chemotaxis protein